MMRGRARAAKARTVGARPAAAAGRAAHPSVAHARRVLGIEAAAIAALAGRLGDGFADAIELIARCAGKVVVTGMGKSGHVCRKIAATLASTGTPAGVAGAMKPPKWLKTGDVVRIEVEKIGYIENRVIDEPADTVRI